MAYYLQYVGHMTVSAFRGLTARYHALVEARPLAGLTFRHIAIYREGVVR
jgi:hypothetical protein